MLKKMLVLVFTFIISLSAADFLEPDQAFMPKLEKQNDKIVFDIKLGKESLAFSHPFLKVVKARSRSSSWKP